MENSAVAIDSKGRMEDYITQHRCAICDIKTNFRRPQRHYKQSNYHHELTETNNNIATINLQFQIAAEKHMDLKISTKSWINICVMCIGERGLFAFFFSNYIIDENAHNKLA